MVCAEYPNPKLSAPDIIKLPSEDPQ
ncbi:hypothetical protein CEXT_424891, partial [Caerostris extrusa]